MTIKEAKPLPDFRGSDAYYVMLTLKGKVISIDMLSYIKKVDAERLDEMTTEDYLLLVSLFTQKGFDRIDIAQLEHLAELEIVRVADDVITLVDGNKVFPIDCQSTANRLSIDCQSTVIVDKQSIEIGDRKKQILLFMAEHDKVTTAQLAEFTGLTSGCVRAILQELSTDGAIIKVGDYRHTHYEMKK